MNGRLSYRLLKATQRSISTLCSILNAVRRSAATFCTVHGAVQYNDTTELPPVQYSAD